MRTRVEQREDDETSGAEGEPAGGVTSGEPAAPGLAGARPVDELDFLRARAEVMRALFDAPVSREGVLADRYELLDALGSGGFGLVYRARDRVRGTIVALKVLHSASAPIIARFKREFRALADLVHPNLVTLYELHHDPAEGRWFFTMRLVDGVDFLHHVRGAPARRSASTGGALAREATLLRHDAEDTPITAPARAEAPPSGPGDHDELRRCLAQLARGVAALHAAGMIHRDLKPSNVLVDRAGAVVILDFGLVVETAAEESSRRASPIAGTPAYMAPEQALGEPASFAGDWYSVGVMLHEALTGRLPYEGHPARLLLTPPRVADPRALVPETPDDLGALCVALLRLDPAARPDAAEVLARLRGAPSGGEHLRAALVDGAGDELDARALAPERFVGRRVELRRLQVALAGAAEGRCALTLVRGESGIGKSALARRFRKYVRTVSKDAIVLDGRCYEQESVPYKALDGIVDALSRELARVPGPGARALLPADIVALARLFPALTQVASVRERCELAGHERLAPGSQELRSRAARALRELLAALAARRLLAIVIDDLHWGDGDSAALLGELLRGSPPPIMLLLSYRDAELRTNQPLARLVDELTDAPAREYELHELELAPLSPADADALIQGLARGDAGASPLSDAKVEALAREAGGHPLFIQELVRGVRAQGGAPRSGAPAGTTLPRLDDVVWSRLQALPEHARRLVEVACVAGRPIAEARACRAAAVEARRDDALARVRAAQFLRVYVDEAIGARVVEAYHDRVRETVIGRLSAAARARHHAQLAREYEAAPADHEAAAQHLRAAGEPARAAEHAAIAGERALEALAFERAAALLRQALDEGAHAAARRRALTISLARALVDAGRAAEAADMYLKAASEHPPAQAFELRRLASAQLYRAGHLERGYAVLRDVLADLGERLPTTTAGAIARYSWGRARVGGALRRSLRASPPRAAARRDGALDPVTRARLETYWSLATTLGMIDTLRGGVYQVQHLALALQSGDPVHVGLAYAGEAVFTALAGYRARRRARRLLVRAQLMAEAHDAPELHGYVAFSRGMIALLTGRYDLARDESERAELYFTTRRVGVSWEVATVRSTRGTGLLYTGRWRELARWLPELFREADDRGDRYARAILETQLGYVVHLARDDVDAARRGAARAIEHWLPGRFQLPNFFHMTSTVEIELYAGEAARARALVERGWRSFQRSLLRGTEINRVQATLQRARCELAASSRAPPRSSARARHLAAALAHAASAARTGTPWVVAYALAVRGGVAAARGREDAASELLLRAEVGLDAAALELHAAATRRQRGRLLGGGTGDALTRSADERMARLGIDNPARLAASLIPLG